MTREQAIQRAQREADRGNSPVAVLNLNPFAPLYVIRDWDDRYLASKDLVARVCPATGD